MKKGYILYLDIENTEKIKEFLVVKKQTFSGFVNSMIRAELSTERPTPKSDLAKQ